MKVMLLAWETPEDFALRDNPGEKFQAYMGEWYAFGQSLREQEIHYASEALEQPSTATVVSVREGVRNVQDGPFAGTKEQLGGFCIVDVPDMNVAAELAAKCPSSKNGFTDVRPVPYLEEGDNS